MTQTAPVPTLRPARPSRARRSVGARLLWLVVGVAALVLAALASVTFGALNVGWDDIVAGLAGTTDTTAQAAVAARVPRTLLALLAGAALAVSGVALQGVTRNPLADPQILGLNSGASLAVVVGIVVFGITSTLAYIWVAMVGAALTALFVYSVGSLGRGGATPLKLALAGAATAVALSSLVSALLLPRAQALDVFRFWQIGGVGGATFPKLSLVVPFMIAGLLIVWFSARGLNSLALGDELAAGLGENVLRSRLVAAVGGVVLCAAATAVCGPIGFVGLVVPHACRLLVGVDHRWLVPVSAVAGALLLTVADILGRIVARPEQVDVGIVTALLGAPFFIWIVRRQRVRDL
ncbi:FecCD family ABC transporter permease [Litorihabitans aurantiacus]|uniref:ABC transporter permease n=1 Tax=Litorihabitans aurantiacus TaxID=1930061 RepID=A0AA37XE21_9MICO|nr:iron ABC transporter permease [Litorihabitans aurantiacus]GMA31423.1 ABC transporter permease [Litorihabitans aurantiacus]